jgi:endonuclease/exonuclease/phosphatase family metal-dependent hydrolase
MLIVIPVILSFFVKIAGIVNNRLLSRKLKAFFSDRLFLQQLTFLPLNLQKNILLGSGNRILLCFLLLPFSSFSQDTITLLSHNVLAFSGHPKDVHDTDTAVFNRALAYYKSLNADVIVLQEGPQELYVKKLAAALNFTYAFFKEGWAGNNQYPHGFPGCVISRFPILETTDQNQNRTHLVDSIFQRHLGFVKLKTPKGIVQVVGLHLCADFGGRFREGTRMKELEILFKTLPECKTCICTILAGDFNSKPGSNPYKKVLENGYIDPHAGTDYFTVPVPNSTVQIDYLFFKKRRFFSLIPQPVEMPFYQDLRLHLSDHKPCILKVKID